MTYKDSILNMVNSNQGLKAVDLALKVMDDINPTKFSLAEYHKALEGLVIEREIVELIYQLPNMEYREKSVYFPKGTKIGTEFLYRTDSNS